MVTGTVDTVALETGCGSMATLMLCFPASSLPAPDSKSRQETNLRLRPDQHKVNIRWGKVRDQRSLRDGNTKAVSTESPNCALLLHMGETRSA